MNKHKKSLSIFTMLSAMLILALSASSTYADKLIYRPKSAATNLSYSPKSATAKFSNFSKSAAAKFRYPPKSAPFNTTFQEWSAQWMQFMLSFPISVNPLFDEKCVVGQRGPVWFLSGGGGIGGESTYTCTIPAGKSLLFPVIFLATILNDGDDGEITADELLAELAPCLDTVSVVSVDVDGNSIIRFNKANKFRVKSVFDVTLPEDNLFSPFLFPGTYSPAVLDGFFVMLKPFSVGDHTVHISAEMPGINDNEACSDPESFPLSLDVMYMLSVVPVTLD